MLTREENERLTRVGQGTPAGELLRRYWYPVGVASELTEETPTQLVRILGETLVLFRDRKAASVCSMIGAHTAGLRSVTVVSKSGAFPAHTMVGFMTREGIVWKRRRNLPKASFT